MKRILFTVLTLTLSFCKAQNVGINTDTPSRNLDINGNTRIRTLTNKHTDANYTQVLITDASGNVDYVPKSVLYQKTEVLFNISTIPQLNLPNTNNTTPLSITSQSVVLTKPALVQINFSVPVTIPATASDGRLKILRTHLLVNGTDVVRATNTYTNTTATGTNVTGVFYNTGSYFINLAAGTHTIELQGFCFNSFACAQGGSFAGSVFQAIATYNDY